MKPTLIKRSFTYIGHLTIEIDNNIQRLLPVSADWKIAVEIQIDYAEREWTSPFCFRFPNSSVELTTNEAKRMDECVKEFIKETFGKNPDEFYLSNRYTDG